MAGYLTIAGPVEAELEVKRSRFLAALTPVRDEAQARAAIDAARHRHPDARHHCSAFVLHAVNPIERSNDDGEPSGTAGAPMLEALRSADAQDVVAVVTRWFGGVLLGTGGLARAYGDATRAALDEAAWVRRTELPRHTVTLDPAVAGRVENALRAAGFTVLGTDYGSRTTLSVATDPGDGERLAQAVAAIAGGPVPVQQTGSVWHTASVG